MKLAVVRTAVCPLFKAPQRDAERVDEALYGMTVETLEQQKDFVRVLTPYRYSGYAPCEALEMHEAAAREWKLEARCRVAAPFLDILAAPQVRAPVLLTLPRGSLLRAQGEPDSAFWQAVCLADGRRGFVRALRLAPMPEPPDLRAVRGTSREEALRRRVCSTALSYAGASYRWGGKTPLGIDCSGLASLSYWLNGVTIYRDASPAEGFPVRVLPFAQARLGDLLYFPGHMAVYLGGLRFVHATAHPCAEGVTVASFDPAAPEYRADLRDTLLYAGTVF